MNTDINIDAKQERDRRERARGLSGEVCPGCGMSQNQWKGNGGRGYSDGENTYCCQGCATQGVCDCDTEDND